MDDEITKIISKEAGIPQNKITENSTLLGDLKIDGDDAWEIFEQCHNKFSLDLTAFDFNKYFRCEPCSKGFVYLYRKIKYRDEHIAANKMSITVKQLIAACQRGKW
jgi:acyl carrier protein